MPTRVRSPSLPNLPTHIDQMETLSTRFDDLNVDLGTTHGFILPSNQKHRPPMHEPYTSTPMFDPFDDYTFKTDVHLNHRQSVPNLPTHLQNPVGRRPSVRFEGLREDYEGMFEGDKYIAEHGLGLGIGMGVSAGQRGLVGARSMPTLPFVGEGKNGELVRT
jgi:hypothetical protein